MSFFKDLDAVADQIGEDMPDNPYAQKVDGPALFIILIVITVLSTAILTMVAKFAITFLPLALMVWMWWNIRQRAKVVADTWHKAKK